MKIINLNLKVITIIMTMLTFKRTLLINYIMLISNLFKYFRKIYYLNNGGKNHEFTKRKLVFCVLLINRNNDYLEDVFFLLC